MTLHYKCVFVCVCTVQSRTQNEFDSMVRRIRLIPTNAHVILIFPIKVIAKRWPIWAQIESDSMTVQLFYTYIYSQFSLKTGLHLVSSSKISLSWNIVVLQLRLC